MAACAALGVVSPGQCGIGGDLFAIISTAAGETVVLNASGRAGSKATADFVGADQNRMPGKGPLSVVTPGCVAGWATTLERFGTRPLASLLEPAIRLAEDGFEAGPLLTNGVPLAMPIMNDAAKAAYSGVRAGQVFRQPLLARTLRRVAGEGPRVMYDGAVGQAIGEFLEREGGHHTAADLAAYQPEWVAPASVGFRGYEVCAPPPNSQAILHLLALGVLDELALPELGTVGSTHLQIEAIAFALESIQRSIADPDFHPAPPLSPELVAQGRARVGSATPLAPAAAGDTVYLCAADRQGMVVSMIQSLREGFGSGLMVPELGVILSNRGRDFSLDDGDPNQIAPRKRPRHTLSPALVLKDGHPVAAYGTRGGDVQPFTMVQLGCNLLAYGLSPQASVSAPRWTVEPAAKGPQQGEIALEGRFPAGLGDALRGLGHSTAGIADFDPNCGVASMIQFDPVQGVWLGGADPRGEGSALAF